MKIDCKHWKECDNPIGGCCALGRYGGKISYGTCLVACDKYKGKQTVDDIMKMPSMIEQAKNVAVAAAKVGHALYKGDDVLVSKKVKAERQKVCDICEFYDAESKRCSQCGCMTDYKLSLATEECPEGKWKATKKKKPSFMSVNLKDE